MRTSHRVVLDKEESLWTFWICLSFSALSAFWNIDIYFEQEDIHSLYESSEFMLMLICARAQEEIVTGGTGYRDYRELPPEVEATPPDYSIYPRYPWAVGFLTRGCERSCD